jgi:hypothetical protein
MHHKIKKRLKVEKIDEIRSKVKSIKDGVTGARLLVSGIYSEIEDLERLIGENETPGKNAEDVKEK